MKRFGTMFTFGLVGALALSVGAGCKGDPPAPVDPQAAAAARAQAALKPLKTGLMKALTGAMQSGGPEAAISVCRDEAPRIAAAASAGGVVVGRTSDKLRNPDNAPRAWVAPVLTELAKASPEARPASTVVDLGEGRFGYVEPIILGEVCTKCHGTDVAPSIQEKLAALYPEDRATGYAEGDLRGVFWAEVAPAVD